MMPPIRSQRNEPIASASTAARLVGRTGERWHECDGENERDAFHDSSPISGAARTGYRDEVKPIGLLLASNLAQGRLTPLNDDFNGEALFNDRIIKSPLGAVSSDHRNDRIVQTTDLLTCSLVSESEDDVTSQGDVKRARARALQTP